MSQRPPMPPARPAARKTEPAQVITSEPSGHWAVALRRELDPTVRVCETRSLAECWARLALAPESLVVVEATVGNLEPLLARMARRDREFPRARVAVVAQRRRADWEWLLREAGAVMFITSSRQIRPLAELARRHLAAVPEPTESALERIWASLPWTQHATQQEF